MNKPVEISPVFNLDKQDVLRQLDDLRKNVENGTTIAFTIATFEKDSEGGTSFECYWDGLKSHIMACAFFLNARITTDPNL